MSDTLEPTATTPPRFGMRSRTALAAAALLALGGTAGAVVMAETRPTITMAPTHPTPIRALSSGGVISVRGRVAEIYGNTFVLGDASGRALVETGREGDGRQLVTPGETVTVQGRFERGIVHAAFLVGADNTVTALGPLGGPPHGPHGPHGGPDRGPGVPPPGDAAGPPPPPLAGAATTQPAATAPATSPAVARAER